MPLILKFITRLGLEQGSSNLYGLTPLAACQVGATLSSCTFMELTQQTQLCFCAVVYHLSAVAL